MNHSLIGGDFGVCAKTLPHHFLAEAVAVGSIALLNSTGHLGGFLGRMVNRTWEYSLSPPVAPIETFRQSRANFAEHFGKFGARERDEILNAKEEIEIAFAAANVQDQPSDEGETVG